MQKFVYYLKYVLRDHYFYYFFKVYMFDLPVHWRIEGGGQGGLGPPLKLVKV